MRNTICSRQDDGGVNRKDRLELARFSHIKADHMEERIRRIRKPFLTKTEQRIRSDKWANTEMHETSYIVLLCTSKIRSNTRTRRVFLPTFLGHWSFPFPDADYPVLNALCWLELSLRKRKDVSYQRVKSASIPFLRKTDSRIRYCRNGTC